MEFITFVAQNYDDPQDLSFQAINLGNVTQFGGIPNGVCFTFVDGSDEVFHEGSFKLWWPEGTRLRPTSWLVKELWLSVGGELDDK